MSNDQIDEYEQGERVRQWLRANGGAMFGGIAVALALVAGWEWWQSRGDQRLAEAANQFVRFQETLDGDNADAAGAMATALGRDHPDTPYAVLAAFERADRLLAANKAEEALGVLETAAPLTADPALHDLLRLRAARVELALGKADQAIQRLEGIKGAALAAQRDELLGDAELMKGDREKAQAAYRDALTALDAAAPTRMIVELKLADAGGTPDSEA